MQLPAPKTVKLKAPKAWTLIGTKVRRLDTPEKIAERRRPVAALGLGGLVFGEPAQHHEPPARGRRDLRGCLFGVRNHANFRPLAPSRGLPPDAGAFADTYQVVAHFDDATGVTSGDEIRLAGVRIGLFCTTPMGVVARAVGSPLEAARVQVSLALAGPFG